MEQSENKYSPTEPNPEPDPQSGKPAKSGKKLHKQGRKGLLVALKRLSVIQTVGIATAIAAMSVGTAYFALVKPQQPEPAVVPTPITQPRSQSVPAPETTKPPDTPLESPMNKILRWTCETGEVFSLDQPVSGNGHVYVSCWKTVYSIAYEGDIRWQFTPPDKGEPTTPAVIPNSHTIVCTDRGTVYSLNRWGDVSWEYKTRSGIYGKPTVLSRGYVLVGSRDLICLDQWGEEYWTFSAEDTYFDHTTPVASKYILAVTRKGVLHAFTYKGELAWKIDLRLPKLAVPAVGKDGTIYIYSEKTQEIHRVSQAGELLWSKNIRGNIHSGLALMPDGSLLAAGFDGKISCFTPDGEVLWRFKAVLSQTTTPLVGSDGLLYISGNDSMFVLNPDGSELVRLKLPGGTSGGIAQGPRGSVYASSRKGKLYSLKVPEQLQPI